MDSENIYESFGFAILRSPLLPFMTGNEESRKLFISADLQLEHIVSMIDSPFFAEALLFSSEDLYEEYIRITRNGYTNADRKAILKLFRYLLRMSSRCTPYGVSAGVASINLGDCTNLYRNETKFHKKNAQINFKFINQLVKQLGSDKDILKQLSFFSNNSWSIMSKGLRYAQVSTSPYSSSFIPSNTLITAVLEFGAHPKTFEQVIQFLSQGTNLDQSQLETFLFRLIEKDLLLPAIFPPLFSRDASQSLLEKMPPSTAHSMLKEVLAVLGKIKKESVGESVDSYSRLKEIRSNCMIPSEVDISNINLVLSLEGDQLNRIVSDEMIRAMSFLYRLRAKKGKPRISEFAKLFYDRYGEKPVRLSDVLDERNGIGYPYNRLVHRRNSLFEKLDYEKEMEEAVEHDEWDRFLVSKLSSSERVLLMTDEDLQRFSSDLKPVEADESIYCSFSVVAENVQEIDKGNFLVEHLFSGGPSCLNNINHYANMDDSIHSVADLAGKWEDNYFKERNIILAEVNYMPRIGGAGNVMTRPNFYEHELAVITEPTASTNSISLQDLVLLCQDGQLRLESIATGKTIHTRSSSSYDYSNNHSVNFNNFLSDLNFQNKVFDQDWSWGNLIESRKYFPRVQYGKCILSKQMWRINLDQFGENARSLDSWKKSFHAYRMEHDICDYVYFNHERDLSLFLDLRNDLCLEMLYSELKMNGDCWLTETLFVDHCFLSSAEGRFVNTFILPLRKAAHLLESDVARPISNVGLNSPKTAGSPGTATEIGFSFSSNDWINDEIVLQIDRELSASGIVVAHFNKTSNNRTICVLESGSEQAIESLLLDTIKAHIDSGFLWNLDISVPAETTPGNVTKEVSRSISQCTLKVLSLMERFRVLNNYEARFAVLISYALQVLQKSKGSVDTPSTTLDGIWNDLVADKNIEKKKLGSAYRNLIDYFLKAQQTPFLIELKALLRSELANEQLSEKIKESSFGSVALILLHQLLPGEPTTTELIVFYDFLRQYLKQADQLQKHRGLVIA